MPQCLLMEEEINLYNYKDGKEIGHYDIKGKSIVKSLMKTPINGASYFIFIRNEKTSNSRIQ